MIGDSVTSIGENAFYGCSKLIEVKNLSNLSITKGTTDHGYVGWYALDIYSAAGAPSKLVTNGDYIFYCDSAKNKYYLMAYTGDDAEIILPSDINGHNYGLYLHAFSYKPIVSVVCPEVI